MHILLEANYVPFLSSYNPGYTNSWLFLLNQTKFITVQNSPKSV